jgi:putative tricarboxylic transport membrane protein
MSIRAPKDFWSGVMFIAFAAVALFAARNYSLGTAVRMGPGYFPMLLGAVLAGIGAILVVRSFIVSGEPITPLHIVPLAGIVLAVALFGALLQRLGLVVTLAIVIAISALAGRQTKLVEIVALAVVLAAFSVAVFVYGLRLPLPIWPEL